MAVAKQQLAIAGLKTQAEADAEAAEEAARRERRGVFRHRVMAAIRDYARLRQLNLCAIELDKDDAVFGGGKGVSPAVLRSSLETAQGQYFRLDWFFWFLEECEEIRVLFKEEVCPPQKTPEQYIEDLISEFREELSHKRVEAAVRRARAR